MRSPGQRRRARLRSARAEFRLFHENLPPHWLEPDRYDLAMYQGRAAGRLMAKLLENPPLRSPVTSAVTHVARMLAKVADGS